MVEEFRKLKMDNIKNVETLDFTKIMPVKSEATETAIVVPDVPEERKKLPLITGGFLNVTQSCNLACKYCFVVQCPKNITLETAKDAAKFFARNALTSGSRPSINFFGGEPMIRYEDIIKPLTIWIRKTYGDSFGLGLTTNGTLLNRDVMEFFKENDVGMLFSIDGDKKTQDINRPFHGGKGSFDKLEEIIDLVLEYHPNMTFRATIDPPTHKYLFDNYKFAISKGYNNSFFIPNVFNKWSDSDLEELEGELIKIKDYYIEELINNRKPMIYSHFEEAKADINRIARLNEGEFREDGQGMPACGRCGLGAGTFASVGASGKLYSCQEMVENPDVGDEFLIGDIYNGVDEDKRWQIADSFNTRDVKCSKEEYCKDCPKYRICNGGCTINNYFKTKDLHIQDYVLCWHERKCIEMAFEILKAVKDAGAEWNGTKFKEC